MKKTFGICLSLMAATLFMEMVCRAGEQNMDTVHRAAGAGNLQFTYEPYSIDMATAGATLSDLVHRKSVDDMSLNLNDSDIETLLHISSAEANTEGVIGKALVMRVVLNRMESVDFPDTVKEVVFQNTTGRYEFSPVGDGSYWDAEVTQECHDALDLVLSGWDNSHGATYFCTPESAWWHEGNLEYLFQYGNHRFYAGRGGDEAVTERK